MASAMPGVRFVRCPKCDKVLAEFGQVPVYRCGGCGTVLRAKARASTAETTTATTDSSISSSTPFVNQSAQSDHHRVLDPDGSEELAQKGKDTTNERRYEDSSPGVTAEELPDRGNQVREMENSLQDLHNLSLTEKKETPPHRVDNDAASGSSRDEQPLSRRRFRHERASSSSSSKDGSTEKSTLERDTTFGSDDFHSVQNRMGSEIDDEDLITLSKDLLFRRSTAKAGYSEPDPVKILRKVDELRDELREFLTKTSEGKPGVSQFHGEIEKLWKAKEKKKTARTIKQHLRPVCGGAPFVVCCKCWTLLQLPADFLVSGRTLHRLQCGACSETLVFSFRPRARADAPPPPPPPRSPTEARHPPSEVDPVSPSKSYSSSERNESMQNVSRSSSYSARRRQRANGPRLHLLMGYNSASEMLIQQEGDGGNDSSVTSTPQFYRPPRDDDRRRRRYHQTSESPEIQVAEEPSPQQQHERSITPPRRRGSAALGLLRKGVREFSHGLENVKLKVHSRGG